MRSEDGPRLANNVSRSSILVAVFIANLSPCVSLFFFSAPLFQEPRLCLPPGSKTYVNVDHHAIALGASDRSTDDDEKVLGHKVPDAALLLLVLPTSVGLDIELEGIGGGDEQQDAADVLQ